MTESASKRPTDRDYIPGLGKHALQPFYDLVHHAAGLHPVHLEMVSLAGLRSGHRVLDVGCGTGNLLRTTGRRHADAELVGIDPDLKALSQAARKARRAGLTVQLDRGFAQDLPYADGSFDRVFSSLMLHHLDSAAKDDLLAEVRRVLRPDGVLVLTDAQVDGDAHERGHRGRMRAQLRDNVGDAVARRIAAAGFSPTSTRSMDLRFGGKVSIEVARPIHPHHQDAADRAGRSTTETTIR